MSRQELEERLIEHQEIAFVARHELENAVDTHDYLLAELELRSALARIEEITFLLKCC